MHQLLTLGSLELRAPDGTSVARVLTQPKRVALLAYLAIANRGFHRRDALLALFWPDADEAHARQALRSAVHHLRRALGNDAILGRGAEELAVNPKRLWCDVRAFDEAHERGDHARCVELYRGPLLPGFHVADAPDFQQWLEEERVRLERAAVGAATALADQAEATEDLQRAIAWLSRATELAPYEESLLRRLVQLLDRVGDRTTALRHYEAFARRIAADLEAEPAPETRHLIDAIKERSVSNAAAYTPPPPTTTPEVEPSSAPRRGTAGIALRTALTVAVLAVVLAGTFFALGRGTRGDGLRRIVVQPLENQTGDSSLDALGRIAGDMIGHGLVGTGLVQVLGGPAGTDEVMDLSGSYERLGDSLRLGARVTDERGELVGAVESWVPADADVLGGVETLRQRVLGLMAVTTDASLREALGHIPSYAAYREYLAGLDRYAQQDYPGARAHYRRAMDLDGNFLLAVLEWIHILGPSPRAGPGTDSVLRVLRERRAVLPVAARHHLDALHALRDGSWMGAYEAYGRAARLLPRRYAFEHANAALAVGRYAEALEILRDVDPARDVTRGYWLKVTIALHVLGRFEEELEALEQMDNAPPLFVERPLAALGRVEELRRVVDEGRTQARGEWQSVGLMLWAYDELVRHGHDEKAERWKQGIKEQWEFAQTVNPHARPRWLAYLYEVTGQHDKARALAEESGPFRGAKGTLPPHPDHLGGRASRALRRGDTAEARRIEAVIAEDYPKDHLWRLAALTTRAGIARDLGELDRAARLLQQWLSEGGRHYVLHYSGWDTPELNAHPAFRTLWANSGR